MGNRSTARLCRAPDFARALLLFVLLLAFGLQSYITQTHIHFAPGSFGSVSASDSNASVSGKRAGTKNVAPAQKWPGKDDPANCPICQTIIHSGAFVTPTVASLALPTEAISVIAVTIQAPQFISAVSHSWRGRAPPKA